MHPARQPGVETQGYYQFMETARFSARIGHIDYMHQRPKLILSLAVVLCVGLFGFSNSSQYSTAVVTTEEKTDAAATQHFKDYLAKCGTNEIRCVWFLQNDPRIGMVMTIHLDQETVFTVRDVYDHALQGGDGDRRLTHSQVLTLKQIISNLPPSDKNVDFNKSVFTSVRNGNNVEVFQYDRHRPPAIMQRIYDIGGGYLETTAATQ